LKPNDVDARQTKLFLLLQTEQYNEALDLIDSDGDQSQHSYERGYSLYRLQRESDARNLLDTIKQEKGEDDRGVVHLEAQLVSFRLTQTFTPVLTLTLELS
jgi:signal recognition particle subunit SRP72